MGKGSGSCDERPGMILGGSTGAPAPETTNGSIQDSLVELGSSVIGSAMRGLGSLLTGDTGAPTLSEKEMQQDAASKEAGKNGTFKSDDERVGSTLWRPHQACIECGEQFHHNHPFHWTKKGPIHGWGGFNVTKTCLNTDKKKSSSKKDDKKKYLRCVECGETVYQSQAYHFLANGDCVHGKGGRDDDGTCLISYRTQLNGALSHIAAEFYAGKLSAAEMLVYMQQTHDEEIAMTERVAAGVKEHARLEREAKAKSKKHKSSKKGSSSGAGKGQTSMEFDGWDDPTGKDDDWAPQSAVSEHLDQLSDVLEDITEIGDFDCTKTEFAQKYPAAYRDARAYLDNYEDGQSMELIFDQLQNVFLELAEQESMTASDRFDSDVNVVSGDILTPESSCHCGSNLQYADCHMEEDEQHFAAMMAENGLH
jgi:hypothetical protein